MRTCWSKAGKRGEAKQMPRCGRLKRQPQAGLEQHKNGRTGPGLWRTGHGIWNRTFARATGKTAEQLWQPVEFHKETGIKQASQYLAAPVL